MAQQRNAKPSQAALAATDFQMALPDARILYCSATGATEVANLAYTHRLGLWGPGTAFSNQAKFVTSIEAGGTSAMELVARDAKQLGLYIARALSFHGVEYDRLQHTLTPDQRYIYDTLARAWQVTLQNMREALQVVAGGDDVDPKVTAATERAFWSAHQRFFNQVITAMQLPTVILDMETELAAGNACVLQLVNTNEASMERSLAKLKPEDDLADLDMTPRDQLMQLIDKVFPVFEMETHLEPGTTNVRQRPALDSKGNNIVSAEAMKMKENLLRAIATIRVPEGPLEMLINHFGVDNVAEVTGRGRRVVRIVKDGIESTVIQRRSPAKCMAETNEFMSDKRRILIFSDAGGTGASYHAARGIENDRRRVHYLIQPGWIADNAVQGFGRTHRSDQVMPPLYKLVQTDLKGQKRFISSIARRLDQLGALTKGQRNTASNGMFSSADNLESDHAKQALRAFFVDIYNGKVEGISLSDFQRQTGLNLCDNQGKLLDDLPPITRFLNRLLSLTIDLQNRTFDAYAQRLDDIIRAAMDAGTLDVGIETIRADRVVKIAEQIVYTHAESGSQTKLVELELEYDTTPIPYDELVAAGRATHGKPISFFARNTQSNQLWAFIPAGDRQMPNGSIVSMYRQIGPTTSYPVTVAEIRQNKHWVVITDVDAIKTGWDIALAAAPTAHKKRIHLITGVIMPIWDRLGGETRVYRLQTTDTGERLLGRVISEGDVPTTLKRLGCSTGDQQFTPERVTRILEEGGYRITLANNWTIKRIRRRDSFWYELVGPTFYDMDTLVSYGIFSEREAYLERFFIPIGVKTEPALAKLLKHKPVVDCVRIEN